MGIIITDENANNALAGVGYAYVANTEASPALANCLRGSDQAFAAKNHASSEGVTGSILGSPTFGADTYVSFTDSAIQSDVLETSEMTFVVVARGTDTNATTFDMPRFMSTRDGPAISDAGRTSQGARLLGDGADGFSFDYATWTGAAAGAVTVDVAVDNVNDWHFLCARRSAANGARLNAFWNDGTAKSASASSAWIAPDRSSQPILVGNNLALNAGSCDIALAFMFASDISNDDMTALLSHLRADLARNGIVF